MDGGRDSIRQCYPVHRRLASCSDRTPYVDQVGWSPFKRGSARTISEAVYARRRKLIRTIQCGPVRDGQTARRVLIRADIVRTVFAPPEPETGMTAGARWRRAAGLVSVLRDLSLRQKLVGASVAATTASLAVVAGVFFV